MKQIIVKHRRNRQTPFFKIALMASLFLGGCLLPKSNLASARSCVKPAIFNVDHLKELRNSCPQTNPYLFKFLNDADVEVNAVPVSVMDKQKSFVTEPHTYCSLSRYSWPSETNPCVYVIRDGLTNPEWQNYDLPKLDIMSTRLKTLGVAFYITREKNTMMPL